MRGLAGIFVFAVAACDSGAADRCRFNGVDYDEGELFAAPDGCNQCVCGADGEISCTTLPCPPGTDGGIVDASFPIDASVSDAAAANLTVTFAGDAEGEVLVNGSGVPSVVCSANCELFVPPGASVEVAASTPFDLTGWGGLCTGSEQTCFFEMPASGSFTVTFEKGVADDWTRRLLPGETALSVEFDPDGNIVLGTTGGVYELSETGADRWSYVSAAGPARVDSVGNVYVASGSELVKLTNDGAHVWTVPMGAAAGCGVYGTGHSHEVSPIDEVAVQLGSSVRLYAADGVERWTSKISGACAGAIGIDSTGVVYSARTESTTGETTELLKFAVADGAPLGTTGRAGNEYAFAMDFTTDDHIIASSAGHGRVVVERSAPGGGLLSGVVFETFDADWRWNGIVVDDSDHAISIYVETEDSDDWGYVLQRLNPTMTVVYSFTRRGFNSGLGEFGVTVRDVAAAMGNIAVVGRYCSVSLSCEAVVQILRP